MTEEVKPIDGGGYIHTCSCSCGEQKVVKYVIPVGGLPNKKWWQFWKKGGNISPEQAEKSLIKTMERYKEEILFDENTGEVNISGTSSIPYKKEYWF